MDSCHGPVKGLSGDCKNKRHPPVRTGGAFAPVARETKDKKKLGNVFLGRGEPGPALHVFKLAGGHDTLIEQAT